MSLLIGDHIYDTLTSDDKVRALVGDRVFPVVVPEYTDRSFVVYTDINVSGDYTKDGRVSDTTNVSIHCYSPTYTEASHLASHVRDVLEKGRAYEDFEIEGGGLNGSHIEVFADMFDVVLSLTFVTNY